MGFTVSPFHLLHAWECAASLRVSRERVRQIEAKAFWKMRKVASNLGYMDVKHILPVFINDTIYVSSKILSKVESKSKKDRGIIHVESLVKNQNDEVVLSFERKVLIKKQVI